HRAERDAHTDGAAAPRRNMRGERYHGAALRLDACNLAIAKVVRAGRALEPNRKHETARLSTASGKELLDWHVARAIAGLQRNGCIQREQGNGEIAEWRRRE